MGAATLEAGDRMVGPIVVTSASSIGVGHAGTDLNMPAGGYHQGIATQADDGVDQVVGDPATAKAIIVLNEKNEVNP